MPARSAEKSAQPAAAVASGAAVAANGGSRPQSEVERLLADAWEFYRRPEPADQERAVELEPENPAALVGLGNGYLSRGQSFDRDPRWLREADGLANRALALAPERADVRRLLAGVAFSRGFHRVALERIEEAERLDPKAPGLSEHFGAIYLELGEVDRGAFTRELVIAAAFRAKGEGAQADRSLQAVRATAMRLIENGHEGFEPRMALAAVACARGDVDEAMRQISEAQDHGFLRHWSVQVDPLFACVVADPRFAMLVEKADRRIELARHRLDRAEPRWRQLAVRVE